MAQNHLSLWNLVSLPSLPPASLDPLPLPQYSNPANPEAHARGTAEEIFRQTGGRLDMLVVAAGTGGTLSGTARRLKELLPALKVCPNSPMAAAAPSSRSPFGSRLTPQVVGVDPEGSMLHDDNAPVHSYKVEVLACGLLGAP